MRLIKGCEKAKSPLWGVISADPIKDSLCDDIVSGVQAPDDPQLESISRVGVEGFVTQRNIRGSSVVDCGREDLDDIAFMQVAIEIQACRKAIAKGSDQWEADIVAASHTFSRLTQKTNTDRQGLDAWQKAHDALHTALITDFGSQRARFFQDLGLLQHDL